MRNSERRWIQGRLSYADAAEPEMMSASKASMEDGYVSDKTLKSVDSMCMRWEADESREWKMRPNVG